MKKTPPFENFFKHEALSHLLSTIRIALDEDGTDLTTNAVFQPDATVRASIVAKEDSLVAGASFFPLILEETARLEPGQYTATYHHKDGDFVPQGTVILELEGSARILIRAERIMLNFLTHLSGIANLVNAYVRQLEGTGVKLLDTRKTLPGLRYPEKYAVTLGGGFNHRKNLTELLMLKDNHIDAAGGITAAVNILRKAHPAIPIEVECRTLEEVAEASALLVQRIMLDNMDTPTMKQALDGIPESIEVEMSGNVTLETIHSIARIEGKRKPNFISVGRLTHSAPAADFSMYITNA